MESPLSTGIAALSADKLELLAYLLEEEDVPPAPTVPRRGNLPAPPLSFAQQRLWFLDQWAPGMPLYNLSVAYRLSGLLQPTALEQSLHDIVQRHEALRTTFVATDGEPIQMIAPRASMPLQRADFQGVPAAEQAVQMLQRCTAEAQQPFDLARDPLCRALLIQMGPEEYVFQLTLHHIVTDGWSLELFFRELAALYRAHCTATSSPLPALPIQYADYAVWQRQRLQGEVLEQQLTYWKQQLAGSPPLLELPTDRPRPTVQTFHGARYPLVLPRSLTNALKTLSQGEGVTLFMTLLAALQALLHRYSGQDDILVGAPMANRHYPELEGLIGLFVNTLVLRTAVSSALPFRALLGRVYEVTLGAHAHQDLPFEKLVEELQPMRQLSHAPLCQVMFAWQSVPDVSLELPDLTARPLPIGSGTAKFDLTLFMGEAAGMLQCAWEYNTDLFDETTIARLAGHFQCLLEGIVANPNQTIAALPLLTTAERQQILVAWNATQAEYPTDTCIQTLFEAQVARTPEAIAVVYEDQSLTYDTLNRRANQVAHYLQQLGVGPEVLVGLCVERSLEMLVGLLGILKAGGAYVPLDPTYPPERLTFMLADADLHILLTQEHLRRSLPTSPAQIICLDSDWGTIAEESDANLSSMTTASNLAYVIYTSGSTGKPKGVQIGHRALTNFLYAMRQQPGLTAQDTLLAVTTISFDIAALELYLPLFVGARAVISSRAAAMDGTRLAALLAHSGATVMQATPATWRLLVDTGWQGSPHLKILCGGEALSQDLAEQLLTRCASLWNMYGPTETTIWSAVSQVTATDAPMNIGRPIANTQFYVLNAQQQPVPVGVAGELYIGGAGLAHGYRNRPELTDLKFIPHPFSPDSTARLYQTGDLVRLLSTGNLAFLGRLDAQVKLRGYRIELGEIEAVLAHHPGVRTAVVVLRQDHAGEKYLAAYFVPALHTVPDSSELRRFLQATLPDYMIPAVFVPLGTLPLMPNGKVDRQALPTPEPRRATPTNTFVAPRDQLEYQLTKVWEQGLGLASIGVQDNFFALGGHSFLAVRLCAQMEKVLGRHIPLASLYQAPTVELLATQLRQAGWRAPPSLLLAYRPGGSKPPFFCVHGVELMGCAMPEEQPYYALHPHALDGRRAPSSIEAMAADYLKDIQTLQPQGPYFLGGASLGGMIAFEMAQQLRRQGQEVALLILIDPTSLRHHPPVWVRCRKSLAKIGRTLANIICERYLETGRRIPRWLCMPYFLHVGLKAGRAYIPQPYPGRVVFFRAEQSPDHLPVEWRKFAIGAWEMHVVPGDHFGLFQEPHGRVFAGHLAEVLDKVPSMR